MSHLKEREEKNCLNCHAIVSGKYCSICGQQNIPAQESVWHLITHTFNDITHFDGKFFTSIKYVITKPGFLSIEYLDGRRQSYLDPIRFYLFASAFFFLILFSFFTDDDKMKVSDVYNKSDSALLITSLKLKGYDTTAIDKLLKTIPLDSIEKLAFVKKRSTNAGVINFNNSNNYETLAEFDSLNALGKIKLDAILKYTVRKQLIFSKRYDYKEELTKNATKALLFSLIPQVLFLSLPFFALFLKLLYWRRKNYYYVAHTIFTIYFYIFTFINFLIINVIGLIIDVTKLDWLNNVTVFLGIYNLYYLYRALKIFYNQSLGKTILKFFLLIFFTLVLFIFLAIVLASLLIIKM